jgi:predicted SnoaL-like aldol condensation-catalyzing enzyme
MLTKDDNNKRTLPVIPSVVAINTIAAAIIAAGVTVTFILILTSVAYSIKQQQSAIAQNEEQAQKSNTTMIENNKNIVKTFIEELFNKHNTTALDQYVAPDLIQHNPMEKQGSVGVKEFFTPLVTGLPDLHATVEHMIAEGDKVVAYLNITGTQTGEFRGIAPTDKQKC